MTLKNIMVHLDGTSADDIRLAWTEAIANLFQAHITGLHLTRLPDVMMAAEGAMVAADIIGQMQDEARAEADKVAERLRSRLEKLSLSHELRRIENMTGSIYANAASEARCTDLFLTLRPYDRDGNPHWVELFEEVLFNGGHGLLAVPDEMPSRISFSRILIAWNGSREVTRAIHEAMPLLRKAKDVIITLVSDENQVRYDREDGADIAAHLARHGIQVRLQNLESTGEISSAILNAATSTESDLIVAGAYGHSRLREWVLGGVSRDLLHKSPVPLLVAH